MRRLKADGNQGDYKKEERSWKLLQHLFCLIPPRTLVVILDEQKFFALLQSSFVELGQGRGAAEHNDVKPEAGKPQRGKKRKRPGADSEEGVAGDLSGDCNGFMFSMLGTLHTLVSLPRIYAKDKFAVGTQHKILLRSVPLSAAAIFGAALRCCMSPIAQFTGEEHNGTRSRLLSFLRSALEVWNLRSDCSDNSMTSNVLTPKIDRCAC